MMVMHLKKPKQSLFSPIDDQYHDALYRSVNHT